MPFDRPSKDEILLAVEQWLDRDVKPLLSGPTGYHLRIATNLLRILRRELGVEDALAELEREGAAEWMPDLAPGDDATRELCRRIRTGAVPYDDPRLLAHLRALTMTKLSVDQPRYPSYLAERAADERGER